jgi:hypothetical protein
VLVRSRDASFRIERTDSSIPTYRTVGEEPPKSRASRDWLCDTAATEHPDFVPQAWEMMQSPRAGDIVAFAANDWSFDLRAAGGHGAALGADMRTSLFIAGPDIPRGRAIHTARLVDLLPTLLDLLGESHRLESHEALDGISILRELRSA